jgi:hypothetical protein
MRGKKEKEKPWKKLSHNWNAAPPIHSGFHWKIPSFPRRFFFSFFFLGHRFSLQVYFRNLNIKSQRKIRFFVCVCFFIWKCCIDSWINGMRGHAVCTAATIQETVEGNKTRCEFVRNQIEREIGKGKRKMQ